MRTRSFKFALGLVVIASSVAGCRSSTHSSAAATTRPTPTQTVVENPTSSDATPSAPASTAPASTAASSPVTSASAPATSAPLSGKSSSIDVCALVPAVAASGLLGKPVSSASSSSPLPGGHQCAYATDVLIVTVIVFDASSHVSLATLKPSLAGSTSPAAPLVAVSGVGDQAFAAASGLIASFGSNTLQIQGNVGDVAGNHATSIALAKAVIAAVK
jgi:chitinase